MLAFVLAAAALVALALAFVLPALWNGARGSAIALLAAMPLGAAALYVGFGTPEALDPAAHRAPETIEEAVAQLERRLEDEPANMEGWVLLGRTKINQGREVAATGDVDAARPYFVAGADAFRKARDLNPNEIDLLVETAEAISLANAGRQFDAEATGLLDTVLARDPSHQRALWFRGIAALQAGDAAGAVARWEALLPTVDAPTAQALREQIAGARAAAGMPAMADAASGTATATTPASGADPAPGSPGTLTVTVEADSAALATLPPEAVLFVFARNADGAGPPVAARRIEGARLPLTVTLSDADRLMPTATLSETTRVEVSARYARSGAVTPEAGDLVAPPVVVALADAAPVALRLAPSDTPTDATRAPTFGQ